MTNFGKFREVEGPNDPSDLKALNSLLINHDIGCIMGLDKFEPKEVGMSYAEEGKGHAIQFRIKPEIKRELYVYLLKYFRRVIAARKVLLDKELIMDAGIPKIGEVAFVMKKNILEEQFSRIRKEYRISKDFNFHGNGSNWELDVFGELKQVRESIMDKLDRSMDLVLFYLIGEQNEIIQLLERNHVWLTNFVDFEARLKFMVQLNHQIKAYKNQYFTCEPHVDAMVSDLNGGLFVNFDAAYFLVEELSKDNLKLSHVYALFHKMLEFGCLVPNRNKLFMEFLNDHLGWYPPIKEVKKPQVQKFVNHEKNSKYYHEKLENLTSKK